MKFLRAFPKIGKKMIFSIFYIAPQLCFAFNVVIDPGHGGVDRGAQKGGIVESEITLEISKDLNKILNQDPEFNASLTRTDDTFLELEERAHLVKKLRGDVLISIHVNSSKDLRAQGKEIYFQNQLPADEEALYLANMENKGTHSTESADDATSSDVTAILKDLRRNNRLYLSGKLSEFLHTNWQAPNQHRKRPIRQAPFHVISNVDVPSVLVEVGYLTNPTEAQRLKDPAHIHKIALGIFSGLKQFKEFVDKKALRQLD